MSGSQRGGAEQSSVGGAGRRRRRAGRPAGPPGDAGVGSADVGPRGGSPDAGPSGAGSGRGILEAIRGRLVVSCQATEAEPLHGPEHMTAMALSALAGGAAGLRLEGPEDIAAVRAVTEVPIVGLWKIGRTGVYITPTADAVRSVIEAGADIVALDATGRERPDGSSLDDLVRIAHDAGALVMADIATVRDGVAAEAAGVDVVSTTLAGYVGGPVPEGPNLDLVSDLVAAVRIPVIAEGRLHTPADAAEAMRRGAFAVVVGGAITRPAEITARFVATLGEGGRPDSAGSLVEAQVVR